MPPEYQARGQVSTRTDSFAFGIVMIELITSLHPVVVREMCDDSLFEELPTRIKQHHDGSIELPVASAAAVADMNARTVIKCTWPAEPLEELAAIAAKCVRSQKAHRATIAEVLPQLEQLASGGPSQ